MNFSLFTGFSFLLQKDLVEISSLNSELKFRIQSMEQQAQLRDGITVLYLMVSKSLGCCKSVVTEIKCSIVQSFTN